jgi:glycerophosphoryl diester phosphodiesterase
VRHRWLAIPLALTVITAATYGVMVLSARSAPDHPFFAAEKSRTQIIAHRGGAGLRPENTLSAFSNAAEIGADILEMDVQATADGVIVCIHDATVDRTTDGRGRVASFALSELQKLDAGHYWTGDGGRTYPFRGKGIRVPTLDEVFTRLPEIRMIVEMKHVGPELAQPLCSLIRRFWMTKRVLVASMNIDALIAFRRTCPEVATSMSGREARIFYGVQSLGLAAAYSPPVRALQIPYRLGENVIANRGLIEAAHRRNVQVQVWTISDEARMKELIGIGVDGIITDRPDRLLELIGSADKRRGRPG